MAPIPNLLTPFSNVHVPSPLRTLKTDGSTIADRLGASTRPSRHDDLPQCQICFDDCVVSGKDDFRLVLTVSAFCGPSCPAILCRGCVAEHVRVSVEAAFPGVLPKVRCPICLVPVNKSKWAYLASPEVLAKYVQLCRDTCSFQTPCCHDTTYTHLPWTWGAGNLPHKYIHPTALTLPPTLEAKRFALHEQTQRFCDFEISSKELIIFIEDTFGRHVDAETQHLIVEHELLTITDEERRATLLLSYHAKYKVVTTRCCGTETCFNCKRNMSSHPEGDCDSATMDVSSIVECRSCHVTMVKVEGSSAVRCWCGFAMDWDVEVRVRDQKNKQLLPVDIYDIKMYEAWEAWQQTMSRILQDELLPLLPALRLSRIDQQLTNIPRLRRTLRKLLHRQHIWRGRFKRALPKMREEMVRVRMRLLAKRLQKYPSFVAAMQRAMWRARFTCPLPTMRVELAPVRVRVLAAVLKKRPVVIGPRKWRRRFARVLPSIES